ncbi:SIR2 family protein [Pseudomonas viridiflava]|uniref:SIR2 family protein n=1 Tax=Pseudomonas viridiflava TaxID=33069 RepID=UPI002EB75032|nr:SIR2 family protein [Pseudomonas viridiflava]
MSKPEEFEIPHSLKLAIRDNQLVVFIGAGISKISGLPSWYEIVEKTLSDPAIKKGDAFKAALNAEVMTPLEALDKIKGDNLREVYKYFEQETSTSVKNPIYKTISTISSKIITTNYDSLIEDNTGIHCIETSSPYNLQKIDNSKEFVLKIHGSCSSIDNAIIFTSDYERLYGDANQLAKFQLEKIVSTYSCLFLGFSLSDNYVVKLFDKLSSMYNGIGKEHYIISTAALHHDFVELITIESHQDLVPLLEQLATYKAISEDKVLLQTTHIDTSTNDFPAEGVKIHQGQDTPPQVEYWTGRTEELETLMLPYKVCFITGIGGQGKSALASKFLDHCTADQFIFCDWRDFKEEELNLQSKLYQLIELVSEGRKKITQLAGLETDLLIDIFFRELGSQKGIFVFDNIDKYIDLQKFTPSGDMGTFFNQALKTHHKSKFIFTCRPFIHQASIGFYQVKLEGLELGDANDLILKYHKNIDKNELVEITYKLHTATKGHPLWMGLILAQSRTDIKQIKILISKIVQQQPDASQNISSLFSEKILENVWTSLKEREKVLLRTLSISNISETEEDLSKIIAKKINYNQYSKALKSLKSLNLIVTKGADHLELHPLVREFIKSNYGKEDQETYISLYVGYLDGFIILLKNKFGMVLGHDDLIKIIKKIEVLINSNKIQDAVNELRLTGDSFQISGYCEDYLRLTDQLLNKNIWSSTKTSAIHGFLDFLEVAFTRMADFGSFEMFDHHIGKFLTIFTEPDAKMILAKSALCHRYWVEENYAEAIKQGKSASDLIEILDELDTRNGKHRYNLALRDSKCEKHIQEALNFFCEGKSIEYLSTIVCDTNTSSKFGNIGRCLSYLNRNTEGLTFLAKSYSALNTDDTFFNKHNLGYASKWIAEVVDSTDNHQDSLYFYINARNLWKNDMPIEANKLELIIENAATNLSKQSIVSLESWQITKYCDEWVENYF